MVGVDRAVPIRSLCSDDSDRFVSLTLTSLLIPCSSIVTPYIASRLGFQDLGGLVVSRVEAGGPAAKAGVKLGDRIRKVNGQPVDSVDDAQRSIYGSGVGDRLTLGIERAGRTLDVVVTLAEAPRSGP